MDVADLRGGELWGKGSRDFALYSLLHSVFK